MNTSPEKNRINLSDIISKQPISNLGVVGNPAHGKSTVVYELSNVKTVKSSAELKRNSTIDLGYANLRIYRNTKTNQLINSSKELDDPDLILLKHFSFVDCPGHQAYMSTMISGSKTFDLSLMLISCSESIPQPQTIAHAEILRYSKIKNIMILINKIDLMNDEETIDTRLTELEEFLAKKENKHFKGKPIQPISAQNKINMDKILEYLISVPNTTLFESVNLKFQMNVLRSFSVNKNNVALDEFKGGVVGGSISSGHISIDDWIIIKPGLIEKSGSEWICKPIISQVKSIQSGEIKLDTAYPGGLIAIGLDCDPSICRNNHLLGNNIYKFNKSNFDDIVRTNNIVTELTIEINYLDCVQQDKDKDKDKEKEKAYTELTIVHFLINSSLIQATLSKSKSDPDKYNVIVDTPIVFEKGQKIPIVCKTGSTIKLFAIGKMKKPKKIITMMLPSNIDSILTEIPNDDSQIEIIDDITYTVDNSLIVGESFSDIKIALKEEMMLHKIDKIMYKPSIPPTTFNTENVTKIIWLNSKQYADEFDLSKCNRLKVQISESEIKWCPFDQMIIKYFDYIFGKNENIAQVLQDGIIILNIKRHQKNSVDLSIKTFIMSSFKCLKCNILSCRIGKSHGVTSSICVICNNRIVMDKYFQ